MKHQNPPRKKVLVVEDDDLFRRSVCGFVSSMGYDVIPAESAETALLQCATEPVDLVLTDYQLASMNGLDLIQALRNSGVDAPSVLMSGFVSDEVRQRAADIHVAAILRKPADISQLNDILSDLLVK